MLNHRNNKLAALSIVLLGVSILTLVIGPIQASGERKPKPPAPKVYPPLVIDQDNPQIICRGFSTYDGCLVQIKRTGEQTIDGKTVGKYEDTWASNALDVWWFDIGDADNDGKKEIIAAVSVYSGQRIKKDKLYDWKIVGFEDGSIGEPSWETEYFYRNTGRGGPIAIGDVNGDGSNETFIYLDTHIEILQLNPSHEVIQLGTSPIYQTAPIASLNAGDADNLGTSEILYSIWDQTGVPRILKYSGTAWVEETNIEPVSVSAIDVVRARDADNIPGNEIISGGNNNRLMIWKYVEENGYPLYQNVFNSDVLPNFTQGLDAGDVDGVQGNEIIVGVTGYGFYFFRYDQSVGYFPAEIFSIGETINKISLANIDNDPECEIVAYMAGLKIFDHEDGILIKSFEFPYGGPFAIK